MNRRKRTEILIKSPIEVARSFAKEIENHYDMTIIEKPHQTLTMIKIKEEARKSQFFIGEVLVTEAKVKVKDQLGLGIVTGINESLALTLAIIDAAYNLELIETKKWNEKLFYEEKKLQKQRALEVERILKTKVSFETMQEY
ncbi:conserved hypothetical protein [Alkaliphilus metalliredigens QYMF]|uniref:Phosphonate C-P lyase system protein PhnG n=1 Tax=Alkaliphilus metalliredigens (strain QYMF) TaxID=293826 RepID=A6TME5_ALKMQ|nr:phosphonate C-P lyase system protein PhnG [Alkaliphilus metalliredigens]ABR47363.1 conserved hypothetical protein [Alkaliphilus metalliredigens QYMF]